MPASLFPCDYIHYNPVRHGYCKMPQDWPYSTIHRLMKLGVYPRDWGTTEQIEKPQGFWDD
ncbi:hypothetical protein PJF56_14765 [Roseofilum sp. BLCC_M91]|uniref:Transposase n=1 Tax=Roseofilum halophilum BLCC-M91 TaxID=3022259 RepID=A0ABT7BM24_9CYAN|nr:hypothetical protein [Roseofilum halophilum]MDJ1180125.1 hypothetical protein [Roseofilum halophilum BLCC-M91]